jgi:hypothetical protein
MRLGYYKRYDSQGFDYHFWERKRNEAKTPFSGREVSQWTEVLHSVCW